MYSVCELGIEESICERVVINPKFYRELNNIHVTLDKRSTSKPKPSKAMHTVPIDLFILNISFVLLLHLHEFLENA